VSGKRAEDVQRETRPAINRRREDDGVDRTPALIRVEWIREEGTISTAQRQRRRREKVVGESVGC
jgi:hypothetical protein